jgi:hypothetical protein
MLADKRRCLAVATRAWRGCCRCWVEERIGVRKAGDSVGRPRDVREMVSWARLGTAISGTLRL